MHTRTIAVMGRGLDQDDGMGLYSYWLLREMLRQDHQSRYLILLMTPDSRNLFNEFPNAEPKVLPAQRKLYWDQVVVARAARQLGADLIFNPKFSIPLFTHLPCVFIHQGSDWYANPGNYPWWDNLYIRLMLPLYHWKARRTLSISRTTVDELTRHTHMNLRHSVVNYAGVGDNFTAQRDPQAIERFRAEHRLPQRFILTVARAYHGAQKKLLTYPGGNNVRLVRGYRMYRQQGGDLPFVIVGKRIEEHLRSSGLTDADLADVTFTGFVPNTQMHLVYQAAECFVLATMCESFGIPILEALSTGCPAIVPKTCACPETAGDAARLIDPFDEGDIARALLEVTGSQILRAQMRERGYRRAQQLTWCDSARIALQVLDEIVPRAQSSSNERTLVKLGAHSS